MAFIDLDPHGRQSPDMHDMYSLRRRNTRVDLAGPTTAGGTQYPGTPYPNQRPLKMGLDGTQAQGSGCGGCGGGIQAKRSRAKAQGVEISTGTVLGVVLIGAALVYLSDGGSGKGAAK